MRIESTSTKDESNLKNHLYLSEMLFGKDSGAVKYLKEQIKIYDGDHPINIEEREYFAFLNSMNV